MPDINHFEKGRLDHITKKVEQLSAFLEEHKLYMASIKQSLSGIKLCKQIYPSLPELQQQENYLLKQKLQKRLLTFVQYQKQLNMKSQIQFKQVEKIQKQTLQYLKTATNYSQQLQQISSKITESNAIIKQIRNWIKFKSD